MASTFFKIAMTMRIVFSTSRDKTADVTESIADGLKVPSLSANYERISNHFQIFDQKIEQFLKFILNWF